MSHDQRFFWTEPFAFAQARACSASTGNRLLLATVLAGLLAIALVTADPPVSIRDFALVALFSVAPALLISYPGMWVFSRLPNSVLIATDRIAVGREVTPFAQVQSAIVGTTRLGGVEHRRTEERRVGKEWVSTWRSRWSPYH